MYLKKRCTYYISNVSIFLEMPIRVIPNRNRQSGPPKTRQALNFFLPNFQGILVGPIGVVWSKKIGFGGHLAAGTQLLGKRQKTVTNEINDYLPSKK